MLILVVVSADLSDNIVDLGNIVEVIPVVAIGPFGNFFFFLHIAVLLYLCGSFVAGDRTTYSYHKTFLLSFITIINCFSGLSIWLLVKFFFVLELV